MEPTKLPVPLSHGTILGSAIIYLETKAERIITFQRSGSKQLGIAPKQSGLDYILTTFSVKR